MAKAPPAHRLAEFDVVRAFVLIGVFTMNYIVQWNVEELRRVRWGQINTPSPLLRHFLDPWQGPLGTRFAATLTTLVGVGVVLLSRRSVTSGDADAIREDRWRLRRRGLLFILAGIFFDVVWPGNILHFTGLFLIFSAWAIRWRPRTLLAAAVTVMFATAAQRIVVFRMVDTTHDLSWWGSRSPQGPLRLLGTPRGFLSNVISWGAHPILPWLSFVLIGMSIAKLDLTGAAVKLKLLGVGAVSLAAGYGLRYVGESVLVERWKWIASTEAGGFGRTSPFGKGMPAYVISTVGSSLLILVSVLWIAQRFPRALPIRVLARAGKVTFTIYMSHGVIAWLLVDRHWVGQNFGFMRSLGIALGSWATAVVIGAFIHRTFGTGPLEWLLRQIGGPARQVSIKQASPSGDPDVPGVT
jgi:uncharacterized protein